VKSRSIVGSCSASQRGRDDVVSGSRRTWASAGRSLGERPGAPKPLTHTVCEVQSAVTIKLIVGSCSALGVRADLVDGSRGTWASAGGSLGERLGV
jgi:hypothetical protein